jgi:hypothetical protein
VADILYFIQNGIDIAQLSILIEWSFGIEQVL